MENDHEIYRELIAELGMSQVGAAKFLGVNERTSRRWACGDQPVPAAVLMLLSAMVEVGLSAADIQRMTYSADVSHPIPRT